MGYHDAAEDHGGMLRLKDIEHNFGKNVARMVEGLSDSLTDDPGNKQPWQTRKESYIERLRDPRPRAVYGTDTLVTLAENSRYSNPGICSAGLFSGI
jgi:(p)ppGpp synthase/HD superfamily hydrolase